MFSCICHAPTGIQASIQRIKHKPQVLQHHKHDKILSRLQVQKLLLIASDLASQFLDCLLWKLRFARDLD